ncbi:MAG: ribosome maturation factor RimP [Burkholderiaceae bacterium]
MASSAHTPSSWSSAVERTVTGLGFDLVDVERLGGGLLRVTIDRVAGRLYPAGESEFVLVEDCEAVTRQLQYVLEVENADYSRLEVSSPGLDRPLKKPQDFERFLGQQVEITLKAPFQARKKFAGELLAGVRAQAAPPPEGVESDGEAASTQSGWRLVLPAAPVSKTQAKAGARPDVEQVLDFTLDELQEARLVPVLDFKGRRRKAGPAAAPEAGAPSDDGDQEE